MNDLPLPDDLINLIYDNIPQQDRFARGYEMTIRVFSGFGNNAFALPSNENGFNLIAAPGRAYLEPLFEYAYEDFTHDAIEEAMRRDETDIETRLRAKRQRSDAYSTAAKVHASMKGAMAIKPFTSDIETTWSDEIQNALRLINPKGIVEPLDTKVERFWVDKYVQLRLKHVAKIRVQYDSSPSSTPSSYGGMLYRFQRPIR